MDLDLLIMEKLFLEEIANSGCLWGGGLGTGAGEGLFAVCPFEHFDFHTKKIYYLFKKPTFGYL